MKEGDQSYKTAIVRSNLSSPMKVLEDRGLLAPPILDYGCGRGFDADYLEIEKYDPHYFPAFPARTFDTITCNYVLNVLQKGCENSILGSIKSLLKPGGIAYITVRRDIKQEGFTNKGTFQRNVILDLPVEYEKKGAYCIYRMEKEC
jgi:hypothetical protein